MGRFHSLDLNQCIGGLVKFLSKELNLGSVDLKSLSLPTKERGNQKVWRPHLKKKKENYTWKFVKTPGKIMEKSWNFAITEKWEPCMTTQN